MSFGWAGRILDVNLSSRSTKEIESRDYAVDWIGGRSLAARLAWKSMDPRTGPYSPENKIVVATGPLTGTLAPTSGRMVMSCISPRAYPRPWYTHSTLGGWFGPALKYAGFDALIISGQAEEPVYLEIVDGKAVIKDASDLWGLDAHQTQVELRKRLGNGAQCLVIGPAGEHLVRFATVQHAEENAAGHSGFGAVWGSKKLKAIVVLGSGGIRVADPAALLGEVERLGRFKMTPLQSIFQGEEKRNRRKPVCSQACTFNCHTAKYGQAEDGRRVPGFCIGGSVWLTGSNFRLTKYTGGGVKIPAATEFGFREDAILHERCNSLGLDMWFRLVMQPWLMRCRQLGINTIRGHLIDPENFTWFGEFMRQISYRQGLGALFADDLIRAMDELEGELPEELIRLGREMEFAFGFPAHREGRFWDEEPLPFWVISAMMYASESRDPGIGTHHSSLLLAEYLLADREHALRQFRQLSEKVWGYRDALDPGIDNKAHVAIWSQHQHMLIDSLPMCDFAFPQLVRPMEDEAEWRSTEEIAGDLDLDLRLLEAVTGMVYTRQQLERVAERAFTLERVMIAQAGRGRAMEEGLAEHFALPCRADGTAVDGPSFSALLDEYYAARGWDLVTGWPTPDLLSRLELEDAIPRLWSD